MVVVVLLFVRVGESEDLGDSGRLGSTGLGRGDCSSLVVAASSSPSLLSSSVEDILASQKIWWLV